MDGRGEGAHRSSRRPEREVRRNDDERGLRRPRRVSPRADRSAAGDRTGESLTLPQLQRQIAYDRLLERLYLVDDGWIVKGDGSAAGEWNPEIGRWDL